MKFVDRKKGKTTNFSPPRLMLLLLSDHGSWMDKNQDPRSGINIPDPQHWLHCISSSLLIISSYQLSLHHNSFHSSNFQAPIYHNEDAVKILKAHTMDYKTIKKPNPKCRLNWCLLEFIDWRYSQSCWFFSTGIVNYTVQCVSGGGGGYGVIGAEGDSDRYSKTPAAKSLYRSIFLDNDIWHCILSV